MGFAFSQAVKWDKCLNITTEHLCITLKSKSFQPLRTEIFPNSREKLSGIVQGVPKIGNFKMQPKIVLGTLT